MGRLSRMMDSCSKDLTTAEDIVDHLRSTTREYERSKKNALLINVRKILKSKRLREEKEEEDDNSGDQGKRKKQRTNKERPVSSSSSEEEDTGEVSTSEDAVYSEKLSPPRFDLTSNSVRDGYAKLNTSSEKPINKVGSSSSSKMTTTMGLLRKEAKVSRSSVSGSTGDVDSEAVEGSNGPTFKDFGGINQVLRELMINVLFPLLNPPPFKKMGVKPPSGILFHGPPGCGKTKLANAIANEAGVPFYQISATEVVSGVFGNNVIPLMSTVLSLVLIMSVCSLSLSQVILKRTLESSSLKHIELRLPLCL